MNLPEFGVRRPITNLMIFCSIIIIAGYSLTRLGIDMMPEIEPPAVTVIAAYPGASPEDVEIKVTETLENQLATTPGIEKITSRSMEGMSVITLKFKWGTNIDEASNDIRDRIDLAKRFLPTIPDEMDNPFIFKFNTANIPVLFFGITAKQNYSGLYDLIDNQIGDRLRQLAGVGTVQLIGGLERQINIWIDRNRLEGYGFSVTDIKTALTKENVTLPVGSIKFGLTDYLLRLPGEFASPDEINEVILGQRNGKFVYLRDVARVEDSFKEEMMNIRINKESGIMMMIQKQAGTNTVEVAESVKKKLDEIKDELPRDIEIHTIFDTSKDIITAVNSLKSTIWLGIILVIFVTWFFLRRLLPSVIVALTIPFSLLIAFIYLFLSGKTINVIGLSSLAIACGMVVDNAIVIVDNIFRHIESGERPREAAIFGTQEMFLAVGASTLTTVVVFLPMLFVPGVVGIMFGELAIIIVVTLMASLFTAVTFTPMLASKWMGIVTPSKFLQRIYDISERWFTSWEEFYSKSLRWCLGHRKTVIYGFLGAFIASLFLKGFVGNEFIPEEDTGDIRLTISLALGTRLEETEKVATVIQDILGKEAPEARYIFIRSGQTPGQSRVMAGASGKHVIVGGVKLIPKTERRRSAKEVAQALREKIQLIPGIQKIDVMAGNPLGQIITGTGGKSIQIDIIGNSFDETGELAAKIKEILEKTPGAVDVSISRDMTLPELRIEVDREKASALGLDMNTLAGSIKTFVEGSMATRYRERGETYDIYVRLEERFRSTPEDIKNLAFPLPFPWTSETATPLASLSGAANGRKMIRLSEIANITETAGPVEIERQNRERVVHVECNTYKRSAGKIREDVEKELHKLTLPQDISVNFGGEAEEQAKAFRDLSLLLLLGMILVYMVMAAQFESLLDPFIIMFSVPFTFTGVILGFILTRTTLSILTFLGMIMLMGIVVNNAIVLISYINILRARGLSMLEAVTLGGKHRLRPVLMTTITTLAGLLPLAVSRGEGSETWQPLGITMISGLTVSTLITMLFVPTLYAAFESRMKKGKKKEITA